MAGQQTINSNSTQPLGITNTGDGTEFGDKWNAVVTKINAMFAELYGGAAQLIAGTSTALFGPRGKISTNVTVLGSSATNTTQTLMSYTLPANVLAEAGNGLVITAFGRFAGNAAPKTMQLNFGGISINSGSVTQSGSTWAFTSQVFKTAANAQRALFLGQLGTVFLAAKSTTDTSVDTGTINISVQALDASAAQSNVLQDGLIVEYFR